MNCILSGESMHEETETLQEKAYDYFLEHVLNNPISTFVITILLAIVVCAIFSKIIVSSDSKGNDEFIKSLDEKVKRYEKQLQAHTSISNNTEHKIMSKDAEINNLKQQNELLKAQLKERDSFLETQFAILSSLVREKNGESHSEVKETQIEQSEIS